MRRVLAVIAGVTFVAGLAAPAWAENARTSTDRPIAVTAHGWHHHGWHHGDRDDYWRDHRDYDDYYYRHHHRYYDDDDYYYYDYDDYYYDCGYYRHHYYRHHYYRDCY